MAKQLCSVNSGEVNVSSSTTQTLLQIKPAANQRVGIQAIRLLGKQPAGGTDTPVLVEMTYSTSNFGTGSAKTPTKTNQSNPETVQTTAAAAFSVEPTTPTLLGRSWELQPQAYIEEFLPPNMEWDIAGGAALNFRVTTGSAAAKVLIQVDFVE